MFDIGFQELMLIGLIGLVVIGPERLPKVARTVGMYVNKLRRFVTDVRSDVERELHADELRRSIGGDGEFDDLKDVMNETRAGLDQVRASVEESQAELRQATASRNWDASDPATQASPESERGDAALADGGMQDPEAPSASATQPDDDDEDVTVLNPPLTARREAEAPPDPAQDDDDDVSVLNPSLAAGREGDAPADAVQARDSTPEPASSSSPADAPAAQDDEDRTVLNPALARRRGTGGNND